MRNIILVTLVAFLLLAAPSFAATAINSCPYEITAAGQYYLNQSISNDPSTKCISINVSNVELDGNLNALDGLDTAGSFGVYVYNLTNPLTNVTVKNFNVISDWDYGIYFWHVENSSILANVLESNGYHIFTYYTNYTQIHENIGTTCTNGGTYLQYSKYNNLSLNDMSSSVNGFGFKLAYTSDFNNMSNDVAMINSGTGISITETSQYNWVDYFQGVDNDPYGITVRIDSGHNNITNGVFDANANKGGYFWDVDYLNVINTSFSNNIAADGVLSEAGEEGNFSNNYAIGNGNNGFYIRYGTGDRDYHNNYAELNHLHGYQIYDTQNLNIYNSTAYQNTVDGFNALYAHDLYLYNNNATANIGDGFEINDSNTQTYLSNIAVLNGGYGMYMDGLTNGINLSDNNATTNTLDGFYFDGQMIPLGSSLYAYNNYAWLNTLRGFTISNDKNIFIIENTATDNQQEGYYLLNCNYSTFTNNNAVGNQVDGTVLDSTNIIQFDLNYIMGNVANGLVGFSSEDVNISNNTLEYNTLDGILFDTTNASEITYNNISSNGQNGIQFLIGSDNNLIHSNNITDNNIGTTINAPATNNDFYNNYYSNPSNAVDLLAGNRWNTSVSLETNIIGGAYTAGNYWSDYAGTDTDYDGLGDTLLPYNNSGLMAVGDYYPLVPDSCVYNITYAAGEMAFYGDLCPSQTWNATYNGTTVTHPRVATLIRYVPLFFVLALLVLIFSVITGRASISILGVVILIVFFFVLFPALNEGAATLAAGSTNTTTDLIINPVIGVWNALTGSNIIVSSETVNNGTIFIGKVA